ncbi:hypothetical protein [Bacillus toyonensis]|uniref:hypothetical protein n=1 Tax=Bacillus toyonensis TaxID=155322 RepID=UPI0020D26895|nr:hypothetical protein [Bacillus toyonensis]
MKNFATEPDQVYYRFVKENGEIKNLEIKIDRGGWTKITAPIGAIIAQYFGVPITPNLLSQIGQQLGALTDGKWEYASEGFRCKNSKMFEKGLSNLAILGLVLKKGV